MHDFMLTVCTSKYYIISLPSPINMVLTIGVIRINVSAFQAVYSPKGLITLTCEYIDTNDAVCESYTTASTLAGKLSPVEWVSCGR